MRSVGLLAIVLAMLPLADARAAKKEGRQRLPVAAVAVQSPLTMPERAAATNYSSDEQVIAFVNQQVRQRWQDAQIEPSEKATGNEWCRRVYLDLLGRVPTVEEMKQFVADPSGAKKEALVNRVLKSDEYHEEFAANWATIWSNLLVGRAPTAKKIDKKAMTNRGGMKDYLRQSLLADKPYDRMVFELITAEGDTTPGKPNYNGAANFLIDKLKENGIEATGRTAQHFLGIQVQCTQCHNHPFNEAKQEQFWNLNAFFRQTEAVPFKPEKKPVEHAVLKNVDFAGEGSTPEEAEIFYELRNSKMQVAYPTYLDGTKISPNGYIAQVNRRAELARLIVQSDQLGRAISNRLWAHFFGRGLTKPIDDLGPHNPPSHPELLDRLGQEVAGHGYDLKRLMRWIVLSEPYSLSSRITAANRKDDPALGEKPLFSRFYARQMEGEQVYDSILAATDTHKNGTLAAREEKKNSVLRELTMAFSNDDGEEATTFDGTIPQALMMMNGELITEATSVGPSSFLMKATAGRSEIEAVEHLYLAALGRMPTQANMTTAHRLLQSRRRDRLSAYQDLWWALLNSNEFLFIY